MLAAVFFMQPVGQLIANLVAVIATAAYHRHIAGADPSHCTGDCQQTTDKIWRWVVGLGAVPPTIALIFRLYIPESPRYMLEVEMDSATAVQDSKWYYGSRSSVSVQQVDEEMVEMSQKPAIDTAQNTTVHQGKLSVPPETLGYAGSSTQGSTDGTQDEITVIEPPAAPPKRQPSIQSIHSAASSIVPDPPTEPTPSGPSKRPKAKKPTWTQYSKGFYKYLITDNNWTDLAGTAAAWCVLDFSFYFLGVNSSNIIAKIWGTTETTSVYELLMQNGWRALITNSIGAMVGGAIMMAVVRWRWNVQMYGFLILGGLFFTVGFTYVYLLHTRFIGAIIVLYVLCQLFFNLGTYSPLPPFPKTKFPLENTAKHLLVNRTKHHDFCGKQNTPHPFFP
jgi:MFS transporter, PHS family, inorganic phosphate transporter